MKTIFRILVSILMVSACTSMPSSPYQAAKGSGYGYTEKFLGANNYSVKFKIANGNVAKAEEYAILRAAELTTSQGYDWFEVKKRYSQNEKLNKQDKKFNDPEIYSREQISHECNLLGCSTQIYNESSSGDFAKEAIAPDSSVTVEISFGKGIRPAKQNIYDAIETSETLRAKLGIF